MKVLVLPILALGLAAFAMPAAACPFGQQQTTEKPADKTEGQVS
ncbi:MAG: hypothetical protein AAF074_02600 [Pseudomonadota bacterium]